MIGLRDWSMRPLPPRFTDRAANVSCKVHLLHDSHVSSRDEHRNKTAWSRCSRNLYLARFWSSGSLLDRLRFHPNDQSSIMGECKSIAVELFSIEFYAAYPDQFPVHIRPHRWHLHDAASRYTTLVLRERTFRRR